ncbi:lipopolysaccharide biosynthesis protein [Paenibacillus pinistramenti]|uniref:lipopolysaccharide biosynthesis protein n=1 Tax=Paenibacillus pinistramenti TaxID=1768003 RepID=UPI0011096B2B|nr:oligosaccharide flippase family protein [Paenibacillus pinistramenti]
MLGTLKRLLSGSFIRNVAVLAGGTLLSQILILATLPLLTRLYTPAEYGTYSMYVSLIGMLLMLVSCAYEFAITLPEDDRSASDLVRLSLLICTGMSLLVLAVMALLQHQLAEWLKEPGLPDYYVLFAVSMLGAGFYQILSTWSVRKKHFRLLSRTKYTQSAGQVGGQLAFSLTTLGPVGLIAGDIIGRYGGLIPLWRQWRADLAQGKEAGAERLDGVSQETRLVEAEGTAQVVRRPEARGAAQVIRLLEAKGAAQVAGLPESEGAALSCGLEAKPLGRVSLDGGPRNDFAESSSFLPRSSSRRRTHSRRSWRGRAGRRGWRARLRAGVKERISRLRAGHLSGLKEVAWRYRRFPQLSLASNVLNSIGVYLPTVLLASFYGAEAAGLFALGQRILGSPMTLLVSAVRSVYLAESSEYLQKSPDRLVPLFRRTVLHVLAAGLAIIILFVGIAPLVFGPMFGEQWAASADFIRLMSVMYLGQFVANAVGTTIDIMERQDLHLLREVIRTSLILGAILGAYYTGQGADTAVLMFSAASTAGYVLHLGLSWFSVRKYAAGAEGREGLEYNREAERGEGWEAEREAERGIKPAAGPQTGPVIEPEAESEAGTEPEAASALALKER